MLQMFVGLVKFSILTINFFFSSYFIYLYLIYCRKIWHDNLMLKINNLDRKKLLNQFNHSTLALFDTETNTKKDSIINDALNCIIKQIPNTINQLKLFYNEIITITNEYSRIGNQIENVNSLEEWRKKLFHCQRRVQEKYLINLDYLLENNFRTNVLRQCARHFYNDKHRCWNRYTNTDQLLNIKPKRMIHHNKQLDLMVNKFQAIHIDLSQQLLKISTGFSLLFPKSDDNEHNNLSLDVIQTIIDLSSLPSFGNYQKKKKIISIF